VASMANHKYIVRKVSKRTGALAPFYEYAAYNSIEGAGGLVETLTDAGWYVIERTRAHIFAYCGSGDYALFTWRKEY